MTSIKRSSLRRKKGRQQKFKEALTHAKKVIMDPKRKTAYKRNLKGHRNAFQAVLAEYLKGKPKGQGG